MESIRMLRSRTLTFGTILIALIAFCFALTIPKTAYAADIDVALTIVNPDATTPVIYNDKITMGENDTVQDLFDTAGVACSDDTGSGYASTIAGVANASDWSKYWESFYDGTPDMAGKTALAATLTDGGHYIFVYQAYSEDSFTYTTEIPDPLGTMPSVDPITPPAGEYNPADSNSVNSLVQNLAARFEKGGSDSAMAQNAWNATFALNTLGRGNEIDTASILASINADSSMSAGRMAKYIMMLTQAGIDCTAVDDNGTTRNLVSEMETLESGSASAYDAVCILPVYASTYGNYPVGENALSEEELIDIIAAAQASNGLIGYTGYEDAQTAAQAILALIPYQDSNATASNVIANAVTGIKAMQSSTDGGFGYSVGTSDVDTTATVVAAFTALGYDMNSQDFAAATTGKTPVAYLVDQADSTLDGYSNYSRNDETMTSATALMGLTAYAQGAGTNVYVTEAVTSGNDEISDQRNNDDANGNNQGNEPAKNAMPPTADSTSTTATALLLLACASGALALSARRHSNREVHDSRN